MVAALQEVDAMIEQLHVKIQATNVEAGHATGVIRELEYVVFRLFSVLSRMGLPKEIDAAMTKLMRLMMIIRMVDRAMRYFMATSPMGWALGALNIVSAALIVSPPLEVSSR